jgi:hypothetical protein
LVCLYFSRICFCLTRIGLFLSDAHDCSAYEEDID